MMNKRLISRILKDTYYVRTGGSAEELKAAEYLAELCRGYGAETRLETFPVQCAEIRQAKLYADGREIPCRGYFNCGSADITKDFYYMPGADDYSLSLVKDRIVLIDTGIGVFLYEDLLKNGAAGVITYSGSVNTPDRDIDQKELRSYVHKDGVKLPCVNVNAKEARELVRSAPEKVRIVIEQTEGATESRNVVAELPGKRKEFIAFTAHYDSTSLSRGSYDNMTGSIGILGLLEALAASAPHNYGARFIFCGSEERGLLGSKAYCEAHKEGLEDCVLCVNLDMIGSVMGKFIAVCSSEPELVSYIRYMASEEGWSLTARDGVYSSDSTPFADHGVPAVSFARIAGSGQSSIHTRYDTIDLLSPGQIAEDIGFIAKFALRMADAARCPVGRTIPENIRTDLDDYCGRKRKDRK